MDNSVHPQYHHLAYHPNTPAETIEAIDVCCELSPAGKLWLRYHVEVPEPMLLISEEAEPKRTDDLWQTTCFEAFIAGADGPEYIEFNFAPSSKWAAYQFTDIREGRTDLPLYDIPEIHLDASNRHFALEASVQLPSDWRQKDLLIGITVVAEEVCGTKSYWALDHKKADPDFHDRSCFIL